MGAAWRVSGILSDWLGFNVGASLQDTPWLLLYGNLFFNLCVVVRAGVDALSQVSASRVAAARSLGATPWRAFWRVEWPAVLPWLASALCLVFLYCIAGFGCLPKQIDDLIFGHQPGLLRSGTTSTLPAPAQNNPHSTIIARRLSKKSVRL